MFADMPDAPTYLLVAPYFTASGTPHFDPAARGAIVGLTFRHARRDIVRAMVEGLAMEMRVNLDLLHQQGARVRSITATGGGSHSREALQVKADVLQRAIKPTADCEGGCLATAVLARAAPDGQPPDELLTHWVRHGPTIEPRAASRPIYDDLFGRYVLLYSRLKPLC